MPKTVTLKVTSAFLVDGNLVKAGELVELPTAEAKDLLHRGKAALATGKVAIHYTDEVHVPEAPAFVDAEEAAEETAAALSTPKRAKKAK